MSVGAEDLDQYIRETRAMSQRNTRRLKERNSLFAKIQAGRVARSNNGWDATHRRVIGVR